MKSKEYLKQIATTEVIDCTYNDKAKKRIANIFPVGISAIKQDLDILEIFENFARVFNNISFDEYLKTYCSEETKLKIKRWLENE